jgi:hypothetical protein
MVETNPAASLQHFPTTLFLNERKDEHAVQTWLARQPFVIVSVWRAEGTTIAAI